MQFEQGHRLLQPLPIPQDQRPPVRVVGNFLAETDIDNILWPEHLRLLGSLRLASSLGFLHLTNVEYIFMTTLRDFQVLVDIVARFK